MNEVLDVMVMMMLVFLESLSPGLDENFGLVTQFPEVVMMVVLVFLESLSPGLDEYFGLVTECLEVMMMMVMLFLERRKEEYQYRSQKFYSR